MTEDEMQAAATRAGAMAMGEWLIGAKVLLKRVDQLRLEELEGMTAAAVSGWLVERENLRRQDDGTARIPISLE